jgi:hypothetical protein
LRFRPATASEVEPVELAGLPQLLNADRNRLTVAIGARQFRGGSLHDLVQNERRELIEQRHVVDTDNYLGALGCFQLAPRWTRRPQPPDCGDPPLLSDHARDENAARVKWLLPRGVCRA